jgi:hypothetical protein
MYEELQAKSFWMAETIFQSEATNTVTTTMTPVSGDDVEEAIVISGIIIFFYQLL